MLCAESLDVTYERILREINRTTREHAYRLHYLLVAVRLLRVEECAEVLAVVVNARCVPKINASWRWEDNEEAVLSACSSFVTEVAHGHLRVVQFSHFSVKEFLTSNRLASSCGEKCRSYIRYESAQSIPAQASLGVLLLLDEKADLDSIGDYSLAGYPAEHWIDHVKVENTLSTVKNGIDYLFDADKPHLSAFLWINNVGGT